MRGLGVCLLVLFVGACAPDEVHEQRFVMGTIARFVVCGEDESLARAAIAEAGRLLQRLDDRFTAMRPIDNPVHRLNAAPPGVPIVLANDFADLLRFALQVQQRSDGAFHPGLGGLSRLWGFWQEEPPKRIPSPQQIARALAPKHCFRETKRGWMRLDARCVFDPGAFVKGDAADRVVRLWRARGIEHGLVDIGGDIRLLGDHCGRPWRIGIRAPEGGILGVVELSGGAIASSGDYERFFVVNGRRYHHILDPRTGKPARGMRAVTVIAPTARLADAAATAIFVAGPTKAQSLAKALGVQALWIDATGKRGHTAAFPSLRE